jgi:hypothetical protein
LYELPPGTGILASETHFCFPLMSKLNCAVPVACEFNAADELPLPFCEFNGDELPLLPMSSSKSIW